MSHHLTRVALMARLESLGIATRTIEHIPVFTVAESTTVEARVQAEIPGAPTKNLFFKDAKDRLYLFVAHAHADIEMKTLHKRIGHGAARLSFGKPELLREVLGVEPGSVTAFAIANDTKHRVTLLVDGALTGYDRINCHPLQNTATTNLAFSDLKRYFASSGHEPVIIDLTAPLPSG